MGTSVRVEGLAETSAALSDLTPAMRETVGGYIRDAALTIEREARRRAPARSGDLARSIGSEVREDGMQATIGSGLYYAPFVELGTRKTRAKPYLYPAFKVGGRQLRRAVRGLVADLPLKARFKTKRLKKPRAA